jgi:phosphate transport system protein
MFKELIDLIKTGSLYEQALDRCYEMLDIDSQMFTESINSLRKSDTAEIPIDIFEMDKKINGFEREVKRKIMTHLGVSGTNDLNSGLILISVVIDIERIGDYTKNIYELAINHPKKLQGFDFEDKLKSIESNTNTLFSATIDAFKNQDVDAARQVMLDYKEGISSQCDEITNTIIAGKSTIDADSAAAVALYARYLKRISAHSRNLVSSIVNPFERIGYPEK